MEVDLEVLLWGRGGFRNVVMGVKVGLEVFTKHCIVIPVKRFP